MHIPIKSNGVWHEYAGEEFYIAKDGEGWWWLDSRVDCGGFDTQEDAIADAVDTILIRMIYDWKKINGGSK